MDYKGYMIYWIASGKWRVQVGYDCIGDYKTIGAAKAAVTRELKKK